MIFKNKEKRERLKKQLNWLLFCHKLHLQSSLIEQGVSKKDVDKRLQFIENEFKKEFAETRHLVEML